MDEVLKAKELMKYLKISKSTMYRMIYKKEIPFFRAGSDYRFSRESIDAWKNGQINKVLVKIIQKEKRQHPLGMAM